MISLKSRFVFEWLLIRQHRNIRMNFNYFQLFLYSFIFIPPGGRCNSRATVAAVCEHEGREWVPPWHFRRREEEGEHWCTAALEPRWAKPRQLPCAHHKPLGEVVREHKRMQGKVIHKFAGRTPWRSPGGMFSSPSASFANGAAVTEPGRIPSGSLHSPSTKLLNIARSHPHSSAPVRANLHEVCLFLTVCHNLLWRLGYLL